MKIIKNYVRKKVAVSFVSIILLAIFYLLPTNNVIEKNTITNNHQNIVYLIDKDNYLSQVITYFESDDIIDEIENRIYYLINGKDYFKPLIPENTKLNNITVINDEVTLDFSNELLNTKDPIKMIEAIVYTLTEINGINNIYIKVDGKLLENLLNEKIDYPLTRQYGINKEYDLCSFTNILKTTIYFNKDSYLVPVTKITNSEEEHIEIIIKELKSSINLYNHLNGLSNSIKLLDYSVSDKVMNIVLNKESDYELLSKSIFENYDVNTVILKNKDNDKIKTIRRKTT